MGQGGQEFLVQRIAHAIDTRLLGHLDLKTGALLRGIGQFAKAVGQLHPAGIQLEAFGHAWIARADPRQCGFAHRILV